MRILVAEDDALLAEFLNQRLLQEKFAVQMVASGPEAQRYASDQSYDLVVLDLNRNGSVGLDALRSIRLKKPDQPVLMAAGANVVEDRMQRQGREIDLSPKEFSLLELLMRHAGQPVSRSAIYLRRKVDVGFELALIRTVRGVGYPIGANVAAV